MRLSPLRSSAISSGRSTYRGTPIRAAGTTIKASALRRIHQEAAARTIVFSAISAWEIGRLVAKGRMTIADRTVAEYIDALYHRDGVAEQPVTSVIAELAARLPCAFHGDPADRIIVATAVAHGATLATRDERIRDYAKATAFVDVLTI